MKILWSSNAPWTTSGYGNQTAMVAPRIKNLGHEITLNCFFGLEGGTLEWNGITCLPTDVTRFGNLLLGDYAERLGNGDRSDVLVMTLMDVWVMNQGLSNMKGLRFACWTPVDHDPVPPGVVQFLQGAQARVIAMSQFGKSRLEDKGFEAMYVPHAVDTKVFYPDRDNIKNYRAGLKIPEDAFVVGMVACNQGLPSRKAFPQVFQAFSEFHKRHSDALLYVHGDVFGRNQGVNLLELAKACDVPASALATSDQLSLHLGIPQELVAGVFNSFDVLAMPSFGEGFGIPLIEAQACGVPVITTDWTAMTELVGPGWLVQGDKWFDALQGSWFKTPYVGDILEAMEDAYQHADQKRDAAREFALEYDVDNVFDTMWKPVLAELERPREIAPLRELVAA
jgi:glycosyltransferase involved in cell wall biosynthesis